MALFLNDVSIINCGIGISAPVGADIQANGLTIAGCQKAIDLRDPPSLLEQLGLAKNTPASALAEVLQALVTPGLTKDEVVKRASESKLRSWLGSGADITTVATGIYQLYESNLVQSILRILPK